MTILAQYAGVENLGREAGPGTRLTGNATHREAGSGSRIWVGDLGTRSGPGSSPGSWVAKLGTRAPGAVLRSGLIP